MAAKDILDLARRISAGEVALFVGAGVSLASGLPDGNSLTRAYLSTVAGSAPVLQDCLVAAHHAMRCGEAGVRLEVVLECIREQLGDGTATIPLTSFLDATPNLNHEFLATCLAMGNCVVTTNFDDLTEEACRQRKIPVHSVVHEHEFERYLAASSGELHGAIVKLHGSLRDERGNSASDSIVASLSQVARSMPPAKSQLLDRVFRTFDVLTIGYSGLDEFDIYPHFVDARSSRRLWWTDHREHHRSLRFRRRPLRGDHVDRILSAWPHGLRVLGPSKMLVACLRDSVSASATPSNPSSSSVDWEAAFGDWERNHLLRMGDARVLAVGQAMEFLNRWDLARACYSLVYASGAETGRRIDAGIRLGWACESMSDFPEADRVFRRIMRCTRRGSGHHVAATHGAGRLAFLLSDFPRAERLYKDALAQLRSRDLRLAWKARLLLALGNLEYMRGSWHAARRHYHRGMRAAKADMGLNYLHYCRLLHNLGLVYWRQRNLSAATRLTRMSLDRYERVGFKKGSAGCYASLGILSRLQGRIDDAEAHYQQAQRLWGAMGSDDELATGFNNLGVLALFKGDYSDAESHHLRALERFRHTNSDHPIAQTCLYIGFLYLEWGDPVNAEHYLGECLRHAARAGAHCIESEARLGLAELAVRQGDLRSAHTQLRRAGVLLSGDSEDLRSAIAHRLRGELALEEGRLSDAAKHFDSAMQSLKEAPDRVEAANLAMAQSRLAMSAGREATARGLARLAVQRFRRSGYTPGLTRAASWTAAI